MKNFIQPGNTITLTAPAIVAGGGVVVVGSIFGVASGDAAVGADVEVALTGVFELPKVTTDAVAAGDKLYWDSAAGKLTKTAGTGSKPLAGYAIVAAANGESTVRCRVQQTGATGPA